MNRKRISSGSPFEANIGYSRAIVDGDYVFVSGTTGFNYTTMTLSDGVVEQTEQCFKNIAGTLLEAGSHLDNIVRITYILPNKKDFEACWPITRKYLANAMPAATMFEAGLLDDSMKIEIEVTARLSSS